MLKNYAIYELQPGMKLGKDVFNNDGINLTEAGAEVTNSMIYGFDLWGVFSVIIDEPEAEKREVIVKANPATEHVSNPDFVLNYRINLTELHIIYDKILTDGKIDREAILKLVSDPRFWALCHDRNSII